MGKRGIELQRSPGEVGVASVGMPRLLVWWAGRREVGVAWACGRGGEASVVDVCMGGAKEVAGV